MRTGRKTLAMLLRQWVAAAAAGGLLLAGPAGAGTTFTVDSTADAADFGLDGNCSAVVGIDPGPPIQLYFACTLRAALQEANHLPGEDTVVVPPGVYPLNVAVTTPDDAGGDLDVTDDVVILGAGSALTRIDGSALAPDSIDEAVLEVSDLVAGGPPVHLKLRGVTLANGPTDGLLTDTNTSFDLVDVAITGSGHYGIRKNGVFTDSLTLSRVADSTQAGIFSVEGSLRLEDSVVENNTGGVLNLRGALDVIRSTIRGNIGGSDGGIRHEGTALRVEHSTIEGNHAVQRGGGIRIESGAAPNLILASTVSGNSSDQDGGGVSTYAPLTIANSTISGNQTNGNGGGVFATGSPAQVQIQSSTVYGNAADADAAGGGTGGGIDQDYFSSITVRNSVLAANIAAPAAGRDCAGVPVSQGYNVIGIDDCGAFSAGLGDLEGSGSPLDVQLGPLAHNGSPTLTQLPAPASPLVDRATPTGCTIDDDGVSGTPDVPLLVDQRGRARPLDGNGDNVKRCDVGAVEVPEPAGAAAAVAAAATLAALARRRRA